MKIKHWIAIGVAFIASVFLITTCGYTKVPAGYEGVKINTLGDDKGGLEARGVGRNFYNGIKFEFELFPLFKQNYVWTASRDEGSDNDESITFQSKESLTFNADVGISYSVEKGKSPDLFRSYRKGIDEITDIDMRNSVRDAFNRLGSMRSVEDIYGEGKADFVAEIERDAQAYWGSQGIIIHNIYLVGEMRPPKEVKDAISAKIQATQIAQQRRNEVEQAKAEADKRIEEARGLAESRLKEAEAEAKSIEMIEAQLSKSPRYVEYVKAQKWDGKLPQFVGGEVIPMISLTQN